MLIQRDLCVTVDAMQCNAMIAIRAHGMMEGNPGVQCADLKPNTLGYSYRWNKVNLLKCYIHFKERCGAANVAQRRKPVIVITMQ